jgi:hypothetical protein
VSSAAFAVPTEIRFDMPPFLEREPSMSFTVDGITATVRGGTNAEGLGARDVHQDGEGLGVVGGFFDDSDIDGFGLNDSAEFLQIDYDIPIRLLQINFDNVDSDDESALIVDGVQIGFGFIESALGLGGVSADCYSDDLDECQISIDASSLNIVGTSFRFGDALAGDGRSLDDSDDFRIEAMSVELAEPVPEPSAIVLMGTGLVGFLGYGWRRKRQQNV